VILAANSIGNMRASMKIHTSTVTRIPTIWSFFRDSAHRSPRSTLVQVLLNGRHPASSTKTFSFWIVIYYENGKWRHHDCRFTFTCTFLFDIHILFLLFRCTKLELHTQSVLIRLSETAFTPSRWIRVTRRQ
jgi:hypothetical protein